MDLTSSRAKSFKRQAVTIIVLLLLAGAYFAVVVPRKNAYFTERYFRLLADTSDQLKTTLGKLVSAVANAASAPKGATDSGLPDGPLKSAVAHSLGTRPGGEPLSANEITNRFNLIPFLELLSARVGTERETNSGLRVEVAAGAKSPSLIFDHVGGTNQNIRLRARADLARLMQPLVNRREFDDVLLVSTTAE